MTIYIQTASRSKTKSKGIFAFGRTSRLDGQSVELGGYKVYFLSINSCNHVRGGLGKKWVLVERDLSHADAISLMNKRLKYVKF
ncbi:MAG: hypothetical protein P8P29_09155 [Flavobacteriaceae bacterium]|nr:hypothetical protein [Flavobacteriaceae bacterium]